VEDRLRDCAGSWKFVLPFQPLPIIPYPFFRGLINLTCRTEEHSTAGFFMKKKL